MRNLRSVDLNLLVVLDALLTERSATRAGARLGMTQSAVSGALARLRSLFADPLLTPTRRGLEPTGRALELAGPLAEVLGAARRLLDAPETFEPGSMAREVRLGLSDYAAHVLLPKLLARLSEAAPDVSTVVVDRVSAANAAGLLLRNEVDFAITVGARPSDAVAVEPLWRDDWRLCARRSHPIWAEPVTPNALVAHPALLVSPEGDRFGVGDRLLGRMGLQRRVVLTLPQFLIARDVLARSDLVALLPSRLQPARSNPELRWSLPPFEERPSFQVSLAYRRRDDADPGHVWLRRALESAAR